MGFRELAETVDGHEAIRVERVAMGEDGAAAAWQGSGSGGDGVE